MWAIIREHFEKFSKPLDKDIFQFQPNLIYANNSISYTILGFPLTAFSYVKVSKKKTELVYSLTVNKTPVGTQRDLFDEKPFFKLLKELEKQKFLFYIVSRHKLSIEDFSSNYVKDNFGLKLKYFLQLEPALNILGDKLDSSKKHMPKFIFGVSPKGKLKCLYKANKKICSYKNYWKPKGD